MRIKSKIQKGTLALVGSGEYLPEMEELDRYLLGRIPGSPRVVCLPTAAGNEGSESISRWSEMGREYFSGLGADAQSVEVINRETAMDDNVVSQIGEANFVYLSGGGPSYLYETLVDTKAWDAILRVLEKGGVVAGCSAGAMIWGERIPGFLPPPFRWKPGFDIVSGASIIPHYDQIPGFFARIYRSINFTRPTLIGIEGYTALIVKDGQFEVRGKGGVTIWDNGRKRFTEGESIQAF